jgi:hypothetical protein
MGLSCYCFPIAQQFGSSRILNMAGDMPGFESNHNGLEYFPLDDLTRQYSKYNYEFKLAIDHGLASRTYASESEEEAIETELADYYGIPKSNSAASPSEPDLLLSGKQIGKKWS